MAIDVGGTRLRVALFQENESGIYTQKVIPTHRKGESPTQRLINLVAEVWPQTGSVISIGIAVPGPCNPFEGILYKAPNIPAWRDLPLAQILTDRFSVPTFLGNDANLAALGEWKFGAARGFHDVLYLTISTGIGGGIIVQDRLLLGTQGLAGELGHITLDLEGPICSCGHPGHLEAFSSGTAIASFVREQLQKGEISILNPNAEITAKEISAAAAKGDALAIRAFQRAGFYLGYAIANFLHTFNPSIIVMGGGVSTCGELLFAPMREVMRQHILSPEYLDQLIITQAQLGDNAGLMGALALAAGNTPS